MPAPGAVVPKACCMPPDEPSAATDRHVSPYTTRQKVGRVLWWLVQATVFRGSFHNMYGWRRLCLRCFGARLGRDVRVRPTVRVECPWNVELGDHTAVGDRANLYALAPIRVGRRVTVSQGSHLCAGTHDYDDPSLPLLRVPITVGDDAWIAADAFVGPGVEVGEGAILGARACAFKSLEPWAVYGGNPAKRLKDRQRWGEAADGARRDGAAEGGTHAR